MSNTVKNKQKQNEPYVAAADRIVRTGRHMGTIFLAAVALLFIIVGSVMLFVEGIQERYLIYLISALLIAFGIGLIVKYYVTEAYRSMHDYSFSAGALIVILGGSALARASELTGQISILAGLFVLATAVVMLQQALQLHVMRKSVWPLVLVLSLLTMLSAVVLLFDLHVLTDNIENIAYWILLLAGILTLICMIIVWVGVRMFLNQEKTELLRRQEDQKQAIERAIEQDHLKQKLKDIESVAQASSQEALEDVTEQTESVTIPVEEE